MNYNIYNTETFNETYNNDWYLSLKKSKLTPPSNIFGVAWGILYLTIIISFILFIGNRGFRDDKLGFTFFIIQLVLNLSWSIVFFKYKKLVLSLIIIFMIVIFTILTMFRFWRVSRWSSLVLIPYLIWLLFATYLNLYIVIKN